MEFFFFFDFEYAINVKNRPYFSVPNGMTMVNATFLARESLRSKLVSWSNEFVQNIGDE